MFTCPADNHVSLVDVCWNLFTCPADNRVSLVDVCLELECLLARLTIVFPWSMFGWN